MAKVLLDHCMPARFARLLPGHAVFTTRQKAWDRLANGALLAAAAKDSFNAFVTVDKKMRGQQNLGKLPLPVLAIDSVGNDLASLVPYAPDVLTMLDRRLARRVYVVPRKP